jgi:hypothetical protein
MHMRHATQFLGNVGRMPSSVSIAAVVASLCCAALHGLHCDHLFGIFRSVEQPACDH